ncbi:hypothetical protein AQJ64_26455 [Streptomyces griseoruber]|uniref:Uncharacterized protein n=1 Tax=Streptomyces griseoruber TaxID=1943 RepID=A0A101STX4_9ACTN|nr:hypothetical protein AQJ64_26455 [Streptomyces griseoruber]
MLRLARARARRSRPMTFTPSDLPWRTAPSLWVVLLISRSMLRGVGLAHDVRTPQRLKGKAAAQAAENPR